MRISAPAGSAIDSNRIDLDRVDLFDPRLYGEGDPHPIWHAMRDRAPVHHQRLPDGRRFWSVTRYDDACRVLGDHTTFTSERGTLLCALDVGDPAGGLMMAATDPPRHTALREPLARALSPRMLARREEPLRRAVQRMLAGISGDRPWDVAVAAGDFPMAFTGALMGVPERDWDRLARCTTMAVAPDDTRFQEGDSAMTLLGAHHELFEYFSDQVRRREAAPADDLIGFLTRMRADGEELRHDELVYNCYSLLLGANVTTPHVVAAMIEVFRTDPDSFRRMGRSRALLLRGIEEGLRWASPANHFMRYTRTDVTLAGERIPAGSAVAVWLGSANRDATVFDEPYRFDVDRRDNRHLAFGYGAHYCVGASLARLALRMLFTELLDRADAFLAAGPVEHLVSNFVAGIVSLPVEVRPRDRNDRRMSPDGGPR